MIDKETKKVEQSFLKNFQKMIGLHIAKLESDDKVKGSGLLTFISITGFVLWILWMIVSKIVVVSMLKINPIWETTWDKVFGTVHPPDLGGVIILTIILIIGSKLWKWVFENLSEMIETKFGQFVFLLVIYFVIILLAITILPNMITSVYGNMENREIWIVFAILAPFFTWGLWMLFQGSKLLPGNAQIIAIGTFGISVVIIGFITWTYIKTPIYAFSTDGTPLKMVDKKGEIYNINPKDCSNKKKYPKGCFSATGRKLRPIKASDISETKPRIYKVLNMKGQEILNWVEQLGSSKKHGDIITQKSWRLTCTDPSGKEYNPCNSLKGGLIVHIKKYTPTMFVFTASLVQNGNISGRAFFVWNKTRNKRYGRWTQKYPGHKGQGIWKLEKKGNIFVGWGKDKEKDFFTITLKPMS